MTKHGGVMPSSTTVTEPVTVTTGPRQLKVAVYADDRIEPKLVGETVIELEPVIQRGTSDEWHALEAKGGKFAGEVYMEMTWYSNAPPPDQQRSPSKRNRQANKSIDDTNLLYGAGNDDDGNSIDEWEDPTEIKRPGTTIGVQSAVEIPSDYPDPDLAPLTSPPHQPALVQRPPLPAVPFTSNAPYAPPMPVPVPPPPRMNQYQQQQQHWPAYPVQPPLPPVEQAVPPPPTFEEWRAMQQPVPVSRPPLPFTPAPVPPPSSYQYYYHDPATQQQQYPPYQQAYPQQYHDPSQQQPYYHQHQQQQYQ